MPPDLGGGESADAAEWLRRARSSLIRCREDARLQGVCLEDLCFDAQQAAEKAIKALLIARGHRFPYVHDIAALLTVMGEAGIEVPAHVCEGARLTRFAVAARYPGVGKAVTAQEHRHALAPRSSSPARGRIPTRSFPNFSGRSFGPSALGAFLRFGEKVR